MLHCSGLVLVQSGALLYFLVSGAQYTFIAWLYICDMGFTFADLYCVLQVCLF
jgi:hypothetical protein